MDLAQARDEFAATLSGIDGLNVRARVAPREPRAGDGWVVVRPLRPGPRFGPGVLATLEAIIVAGPEEGAAETFVDTYAAPVLRAALTSPDLGSNEVTVEPQQILVGANQVPLYALSITATFEVE